MQDNVIVSFIKPEPQKITLGMKRKAYANCFESLGYNFVKTIYNFHTPVKEIAAKITAVGKYVVIVNNPITAPIADIRYSGVLIPYQ